MCASSLRAFMQFLLQILSVASSSPVKSRRSKLATSPTNAVAKRGGAKQKHPKAAFEFGNQLASQSMFLSSPHNATTGSGQLNQHEHQPKQQHAPGHQDTLTPSPDSPGQWSSGSPQSYSDWSDGVHSPQFTQHLQQQQKQQQQLQQNGGSLNSPPSQQGHLQSTHSQPQV